MAVLVAALLVAVRLSVTVVARALGMIVLLVAVALVIVRGHAPCGHETRESAPVAVLRVIVARFVVRVLARVVRRAGVAVVEVGLRLLLGLHFCLGRLRILERRQGLLLRDLCGRTA